MSPDSGYLSMSLDVDGVVRYAQHTGDVDLLRSTFPDLTDEMAFALVDGTASLTLKEKKLVFTRSVVH
jgi:hypothetical protein